MDFFARQEIARRNSRWLIVYFVLAVIGTILAVHLAVTLAFGFAESDSRNGVNPAVFLNPQIFMGVALGMLAVITCGSTYKILQLSGGGSAVAEMLRGRPITSNSADPNERRLLNVVEEMSIASGTPMPQIYVLDQENTINAFAAGHSTNDMAICVTRGCLNSLSRDELQGVIGHEFSHILNGDMRLNLRLMGFVFGILCVAMVGRILLRCGGSSSGSKKGGNPLPLLGLALFIIGYIGVFFTKLIKSAVSRQREFLADAASTQFTRNPSGLANALKKVAVQGSHIDDPNAEEASHLFFANGLRETLFDSMSTHPPIDERIRELEPNWDGKYLYTKKNEIELMEQIAKSETKKSTPAKPALPSELATALGVGVLAASATANPVPMSPVGVVNAVGAPGLRHLDYAAELIQQIPAPLSAAAHEPLGASALVHAFLLSPDEAIRAGQLKSLESETILYPELVRLLPEIEKFDPRARLHLLTLAMTALRGMSASQYEQFTRTTRMLIESDGQIDLFEYLVQKIVQRRLDPYFKTVSKTVVQYYVVKPVLPDCRVLLSALANCGHTNAEAIQNAFLRGAQELPFEAGSLHPLEPAVCGIDAIDAALNRLNLTTPQIKKMVLGACAETVAADGEIQPNEAELLRAIADTLDCPLPPFLTV